MAKPTVRYTTLVLVVLLCWVLVVETGFLSFGKPAHARYVIRGIDVSHHQADIDWSAIRSADIDFAFIKATEGTDWLDTRFAENWREAGYNGIARGAYHFFRFCKPGAAQAEFFLSQVPDGPRLLPPMVDVEYSGNCGRNRAPDTIRDELQTYLDVVTEQTGSRPIIYTDSDAYQRIVSGYFEEYPLWVPSLSDEPALKDGRRWTFWQYDHNGEVDGIDGPVDLNVFAGSRWSFGQLIN